MDWKKHLISVDQFNVDQLDEIFNWASTRTKIKLSKPKKIATLFYEPSTRTSASFQAAAYDLNCNVIAINEVAYSSVTKGENIQDTLRTLGQYVDLIVLRHPDSHAAEVAADYSPVPIINAGCGIHEHPTQALLDLFTIREKFQYKDLTITFFGDLLNSRTVHSLVKLLALYKTSNIRINFVAPFVLQIPDYYMLLGSDAVKMSNSKGIIDEILPQTDVLYITRVQKERGSKADYKLTVDQLRTLPKEAIVMHPFPRNEELPMDFDNDPRAAYFKQIKNGLKIRTVLLSSMLTQ